MLVAGIFGVTDSDFSIQTILEEWDVNAEQRKADFLDYLYELYEVKTGLYTGLWLRFQKDLAECFRDQMYLNLEEETTDAG